MEDNNTIFTHAKMEYTSQLIENLTPHMFDGIKSIYDESKVYQNNNINTSILIIFRTFLEKVPVWSNEIIEAETERIIQVSKCDWIDDLITAVFISHTKILASIGTNINANIDLTIPKTINFIHKCYINIAREIWKNPYLFDDNLVGSEYQKNMRTIEVIIKESIEYTVRKLLPVKEILRQHLDTYDNSENKRKTNSEEIRSLLLDELKNLSILNIKDENNKGKIDTEKEYENQIKEKDTPEENNEIDNNETPREDSIEEKIVLDDSYNEDKDDDENTEVNNYSNEFIMLDKNENNINEDGYISPDEEEVKRNCDGLEINNIPDITEEKYDNIDIIEPIGGEIDKGKLISKYMNSLNEDDDMNIQEVIEDDNSKINEDKKVFNVEKEDEKPLNIEKEDEKSFNVEKEDEKPFNVEKEDEKPLNIEKEDEKPLNVKKEDEKVLNIDNEGINVKNEIKVIKDHINDNYNVNDNNDNNIIDKDKNEDKESEQVKNDNIVENNIKDNNTTGPEIISILKQDIPDDAQTIDNFFEDISNLMEKKNIQVNKESKAYTLFDDAIDE